MTKTHVNLNGLVIEILRKPVKHIYLRIYPPDGQVKISVPRRLSDKQLFDFIHAKQSWIEEKRHGLLQKKSPLTPQLKNGDAIYFLGNRFMLNIRQAAKNSLIIQQDQFMITLKTETQKEQIELFLEHWFKLQMAELLPSIINKWCLIINIQQPQWSIRKMKTRWGSCNTRARRICLNLQLIHKPLICLEYVLVHELIHLLEPGHNQRFYQLMTCFMPEWKKYKEQLESVI